MTALAGLWRLDGNPDAADACDRMLTAQRIYGPDDGAQWSEAPVALGRRLFRLLPEDIYDRQPLHSADGHIVLVADVRLDNRDELCAALNLPAERAGLSSDADILLAAFARWAEDCCDHLIGDFAFALWDKRNRRFFLARDPLGARPLHYHCGARFFAFATMPKGLHALAEISRQADEDYLAWEMITARPLGTRTCFRDIARVEPGHIARVTRDGVSTRRYWNPERKTLVLRNADAYAEACREQLDIAVRCRLRGANHVATHLSAGLDSSAVTATAARLLAGPGGRVTAFTAVPRENYELPVPRGRIGDEGPFAALTAAMYPNVEHVLVRTGDGSPLDRIDRYFYLFERPVPNLCNMIWVSTINDAARERKLKVLLSASIGNLTISYAGLALLPELVRSAQLLKLSRQVAMLVRQGGFRWRGAVAATIAPFFPPWLWSSVSRWFRATDLDPRAWTAIHPDRFSQLRQDARGQHQDLSYRPPRDGFDERLSVLFCIDSGNFRKGTLAGWGLDHRDPTADRRLIEFCLSVPTEQFLRDGVQRALARHALADRLPQDVLLTKSRGLQAIDWHEGLTSSRARLRDEIDRLNGCGPAVRTLDLTRLGGLVDNWPADGWERTDTIRSYRLALLRGLSVGHFLRSASGSNA
jgi:asparagine synthase (glutamine-hydrolysing)